MKNDRGMIKWAPFNSVISNKYIINSLIKEKSKISQPILSNEEMLEIEEKIISAYYSKCCVTITYFQSGYLENIVSKIKKIDKIYKIIYLENTSLFFKQIIDIKL